MSMSMSMSMSMEVVSSSEEKDKRYSLEIAKRSVARAALHLGITSMSSEALDVMGDALLTFLERLGGYISESAEVSGRSSSHVNILDALQGIECISGDILSKEAALESTLEIQSEGVSNTVNGVNGVLEALATFGYGPNWRMREENGWNAPYLDMIPSYPLLRQRQDKGHKATQYTQYTQCTQYKALEDEACVSVSVNKTSKNNAQERLDQALTSIPDAFWGDQPCQGANEEDRQEEEAFIPPTMTTMTTKRRKVSHDHETYVPSFLPPFPPFYTYQQFASSGVLTLTQQRCVTDTNIMDSSVNVRRSLVQLHHTSYQDNTDINNDDDINNDGDINNDDDINNDVTEDNQIVVPLGVVNGDASSKDKHSVTALSKASGSRIPRILEGSMDTVPC